MIDLRNRLSEFSYGYGITREIERVLAGEGITAVPFLPSLIHEAELGFDMLFQAPGDVLAVQFKLGYELRRLHNPNPPEPLPELDRPFWRFEIDVDGHQFDLMRQFQGSALYAAPRFAGWAEYSQFYEKDLILANSLLITPQDIWDGLVAKGEASGVHKIIYDRTRHYVCSDPFIVPEMDVSMLVSNVRENMHRAGSLGQRLALLSERPTSEYRKTLMLDHKQADRSHTAVALRQAKALGMEAWVQGIQLFFVRGA